MNLAWQLVQNTGCNVFLTGKAGTGKTTFLKSLYAQTHKRAIILAPTGIAAINAGGATLHSFFQLPFAPYIPGTTNPAANERQYKFSEKKRRLIRSLDLIIIDEISMVRADLLDSVDAVLRRFRDRTKPFGGVQLLLIGDLQQLAPVVKQEEWNLLQTYYDTQYFFSSLALKEAGYVTVELQRVYRQSEKTFIELLNRVRNNEADFNVLQTLNERYRPGFAPAANEGYIRLVTHNRQADEINDGEMAALASEPHTYEAEVWHEFPEAIYPLPAFLTLKVGAQVMFVKNDSNAAKRYFNGMLGTVISTTESCVKVRPHEGGEIIDVTVEQWENNRYELNETTKEIEEELIGTFQQIPLKPAWAITVHKSQGLTFERAIIDVQHSFSHGQTYVALSRCRSLEGLVLSSPIPPHAIINDAKVVAFNRSIADQVPSEDKVALMERDYFLSLLAELFTFHAIRGALDAYLRYLEEWFSRPYPEAVQQWREYRKTFDENVDKVSVNFSLQYQRIIGANFCYAESEILQERCRKGAKWFREQISPILPLFNKAKVATKNKNVSERELALREELKNELKVKILLLNHVEDEGFSPKAYLHKRALATIGDNKRSTSKAIAKRSSKNSKKASAKAANYNEIVEETNTYDLLELNETEVEMPDFSHCDLPY